MRANRRALRRALRRDRRTRAPALLASWALAPAHLVSAYVKATPSRGGHARLLSATGAARHAGHGAGHDGHVGAQ